MNKYTELSDFEINKKVASHYLPCDYNLNDHAKTVELIRFLGDTAEYRVYGKFDPCNNPSDAMPIIIENEISMIKSSGGWMCCHGSVGQVEHEILYRGAMELFLMMKDTENNQ
ncbi:phage protein NinX family protein [Proteus sp. TSJ240517]|uniref:phage protein NinX family protein n=1 Tax=Proteus sp. TSJ240517 TaxID=3399622 RepID=UPI003A4D2357